MMKKNALDFENRRKIFNYISEHPGIHTRELSRRLNLAYSTLNYHLYQLEKQDFITCKKQRKYQRYYAKYKVGVINRTVINLLRERVPNKIIIFLLAEICGTRKEISKAIEITSQAVAFHLKKLIELDVVASVEASDQGFYLPKNKITVERTPQGSEIIYKLKNPQLIYSSLITYQNCVTDFPDIDLLFSYFEFWFNHNIPKRIPNKKKFWDKLEDRLYDIFPHPYYG